MWPRRSQIISPLKKSAVLPKGRKILWNDALENSFNELKHVVSSETLVSYPYCTITLIVHTDASDKQLGDVISHNKNIISLLSRRIINPQCNYTTTEMKILAIVKFL